MAPKTVKKILTDMLENLSKADFDKFCHQLVDRREEPQVRRNKVENKSFLDIANVLVSTFTEARAPAVVEELLRDIECNAEADRLVIEMGGLSAKPDSSDTARSSAGASGVNTTAKAECTGGKHFVDKHRLQLIERVSNIAPILDELLDKNVIQQGTYDEIFAIPTSQAKMRKLYSGPLNAAGPDGKDVFYKILEEKEKYLIADLKKQK